MSAARYTGGVTPHKKRIIAILVPIQMVLAALAWRDLARQPATRVRGPKRFWRVFVMMNPGNSAVYWLVGRRKAVA
jgi:hypothetical protein